MMTEAQWEQKILNYMKGLSKEALQEVLDFIQFLKYKKRKEPEDINITEQLSNLDSQQMEHLEKEFDNYKELYPRE